MKVTWNRLIRFVGTDGKVYRGEPILPSSNFDLGNVTEEDQLQAKLIEEDDIYGPNAVVTEKIATVSKLLGPLAASDVPILRCVGLNYTSHIKEAGRQRPPFPFIFFKPSTCVLDHGASVVVPEIAQDEQADYEGELCMVIGKDAKDIPNDPKLALEYVAAYTCGNDISARKLQRDPELAGRVPQWGFSKGFDTFAPMGPALLSRSIIPDPSKLHLITTINGEKRQSAGLDDLASDCAYLIHYLSQGTTLQKGSVIMTGTPGGVGVSKTPPFKPLTPGTDMRVTITHIGTLRNGVEYA